MHKNSCVFTFRWLNNLGVETGYRRKVGEFTGRHLILDDIELPVGSIIEIVHQRQRLVLGVLTEDDQMTSLPFTVLDVDAGELKDGLNVARSAIWARQHRQNVEQRGLGHTCRIVVCPHCSAMLILTNTPKTAQVYCQFCESLTTCDATQHALPDEETFKLCEECHMFSKRKRFTLFYFYFIVFAYGYRLETTWRCPGCMRKDAWKMFFGNFPFGVGIPVALSQLARSYRRWASHGADVGLDAANLQARRGDATGAFQRYRDILEQFPHSAGIKYNLALVLLQQSDTLRAAEMAEAALGDCGNYGPAYGLLRHCYEELGEKGKLSRLEEQWNYSHELRESVDADGDGREKIFDRAIDASDSN